MNAKSILVAFSVLAVALAGCSDDPPSGDISGSRSGLTVDGTIDLEYQAANNPYPYAGTELEALFACNPDALAGPAGQETCSDPYSIVSAHVMTVPMPSSDGYKLYYTSSSGEEMEIGALTETGGMYNLNQTFEEDYSSFEEIHIRMGSLSIATATNGAGSQTFAANQSLMGTSLGGSWKGKTLNLEVSGLPAVPSGVTFNGWLVSVDADTGEKTHEEQFPIEGDGAVSFKASKSLTNYDEVHVHVAGSQVNLAIADL